MRHKKVFLTIFTTLLYFTSSFCFACDNEVQNQSNPTYKSTRYDHSRDNPITLQESPKFTIASDGTFRTACGFQLIGWPTDAVGNIIIDNDTPLSQQMIAFALLEAPTYCVGNDGTICSLDGSQLASTPIENFIIDNAPSYFERLTFLKARL